jgi:glucose-6-phosphate isomerase
MKISKPMAQMNNLEGLLEGEGISHAAKLLKDISFIYENAEGCDPETVMYEVCTCERAQKGKKGDLLWGLSILHPVRINGECCMTRGHWHVDRDCAEFYYGIKGRGLLLMMDEKGECFGEEVFPGSLHYIDGRYAHRLINTSADEDLKVGACWPVTAGHDYAATEKQPFTVRVFLENGEVVCR